ncbi:MAG: hypothetical protein PHT51_00515 [Patescibacteria group bacterium]|nr:hypothetical protein [Patescibacteria group bacterium]MDD4610746.1 hypothetical protein [Patescibacteria group bacterium]
MRQKKEQPETIMFESGSAMFQVWAIIEPDGKFGQLYIACKKTDIPADKAPASDNDFWTWYNAWKAYAESREMAYISAASTMRGMGYVICCGLSPKSTRYGYYSHKKGMAGFITKWVKM